MDLDSADAVDGYRLRRRLGAGSVGAVWLARDLTSGRPVVIKQVPLSSAPAAPVELRRGLALARGLGHPHVVRLVEVRRADRCWLVVSEYVAAGPLAALLRRRGPLRTGELVTLLSPIADALGAAHRAGLAHGHLGTGDILLTAQGRPLLADLGLHPGTPAADLVALGQLARSCGDDPAPFAPALFTGDGQTVATRLLALADPEPIDLGFDEDQPADPDLTTQHDAADSTAGPALDSAPGPARAPAASPAAWSVASPAVRSASPAVRSEAAAGSSFFTPVPAIASRRSPPVIRSGRRSQLRPLAVIAGGVVVLGLVVGLGINELRGRATAASSRPDEPGASTSPEVSHSATIPSDATPATRPSTTPGGVEDHGARGGDGRSVRVWTATLAALDGRRAAAFARLAPSVLDQVYLPDSAPWRADRALLASYRQRDVRVDGLRIEIQRVGIARRGNRSVILRVLDRFAGGTAVDQDGRRTPLPPGQPTTRLITLTASPHTWRISHIAPA